MDIPAPKPAQVIRYSYLWADEHAHGLEEGTKNRPASIVLTMLDEAGLLRVGVVAITHSRPRHEDDAVEIPAAVSRMLGLDDEPSWAVVTEMNVFVWPGPDLRQVSDEAETVLYGYLPEKLFLRIRDKLVANIKAGKARQVTRTE